MTILDVFDPKSDGWSFENWNDTVPFTWDLYRKTYLAINPTNDPVEAPLDVAYYEIFKNCSQNGNCGGLCLLALALFKYGGYMGYCSPPNFYTGTTSNGPTHADLKTAINIMQARQFSAAGIRNFVDVVKSGDLNAMTVYTRVQDGLASGDYCIISLANTLFGGDTHTIIPYRAEMIGGVRTIHVWDPNRPYNVYPDYYDADHNKIEITGPTGWSYNQNGGSLGLGGFSFAGSDNGWFFAIPTSLEIHKGRQPFSLGFAFHTADDDLRVRQRGRSHPDRGCRRPALVRRGPGATRRAGNRPRAPSGWCRAVAMARRPGRRTAWRAVLSWSDLRQLSVDVVGSW